MAAFCGACGHACVAQCVHDCRRLVGWTLVWHGRGAPHLCIGRGCDVGRCGAVERAVAGLASSGHVSPCGFELAGGARGWQCRRPQAHLAADGASLVGRERGADFIAHQHPNCLTPYPGKRELAELRRPFDGVPYRVVGRGFGRCADAATLCRQSGQ